MIKIKSDLYYYVLMGLVLFSSLYMNSRLIKICLESGMKIKREEKYYEFGGGSIDHFITSWSQSYSQGIIIFAYKSLLILIK